MFKYQILHINYMNARFKRLNKPPAVQAAPVVEMPHPVIIEEWLRRDRQRREREDDAKRPRIRAPEHSPQMPPQKKEEPKEIRIDITDPDNTVN
jgi:hypothetical protein